MNEGRDADVEDVCERDGYRGANVVPKPGGGENEEEDGGNDDDETSCYVHGAMSRVLEPATEAEHSVALKILEHVTRVGVGGRQVGRICRLARVHGVQARRGGIRRQFLGPGGYSVRSALPVATPAGHEEA